MSTSCPANCICRFCASTFMSSHMYRFRLHQQFRDDRLRGARQMQKGARVSDPSEWPMPHLSVSASAQQGSAGKGGDARKSREYAKHGGGVSGAGKSAGFLFGLWLGLCFRAAGLVRRRCDLHGRFVPACDKHKVRRHRRVHIPWLAGCLVKPAGEHMPFERGGSNGGQPVSVCDFKVAVGPVPPLRSSVTVCF